MGMSASQMRYVMISGKKSDVEFQGQQINQQRTTLATQSSAYNTQLLNLSVPTPPSTSDYTKTSYTFTSGAGETCTVSGLQYNSSGVTTADGTRPNRWTINYTTTGIGDEGKIFAKPSVSNAGGVFSIGGNVLTPVDLTSLTSAAPDTVADTTAYSNILKICQDTGILKDAAGATISNPTPAEAAGRFYSYTSDGTTKYILASSITDIPSGGSEENYSYYVDSKATVTKTGILADAKVNFSESNRMTSITAQDADGNTITYTPNVSTTNDKEAYDQAFNEYEYQKGKYEQTMNNINSQMEIIEAQDKKLELKLQDLDTQQQALSTEMDSVKKVIDKNIETSFKAFA